MGWRRGRFAAPQGGSWGLVCKARRTPAPLAIKPVMAAQDGSVAVVSCWEGWSSQVPAGDLATVTEPARRVSLPWGCRYLLETLATVAQMRRQ